MITLKQLQYVLAISETLHFKKAAVKCHISQSALSTAIHALEQTLQTTIFERSTKKVLITPMGQEVIAYAKSIQQDILSIENLAKRDKAPFTFPISLGMIPTIAPYLVPKVLPQFMQAYPQSQLSIHEDLSKSLVERV